MNRENKRKLYDKHYYKTHPCDEAFTCKHCGRLVVPEGAGSDHRNHCPYCLCSVHLDNAPGDREADCGALMEPIGVWVRKNGEWALLHRCRMCGTIHANRVAADDNPLLLMSLASKPLACPPLPWLISLFPPCRGTCPSARTNPACCRLSHCSGSTGFSRPRWESPRCLPALRRPSC